jgi:hypothetical protein
VGLSPKKRTQVSSGLAILLAGEENETMLTEQLLEKC